MTWAVTTRTVIIKKVIISILTIQITNNNCKGHSSAKPTVMKTHIKNNYPTIIKIITTTLTHQTNSIPKDNK